MTATPADIAEAGSDAALGIYAALENVPAFAPPSELGQAGHTHSVISASIEVQRLQEEARRIADRLMEAAEALAAEVR